ncbi:MAG: bifunctional diaminohydroxyphosphoribosylaminopyrimidine deaminase/5-amino-6-(5-phosphoribosylamino)uracil reductase RibD [Chloroflexota bacterium]
MDYMAQALSLARLAQGQVSPNPAVGALVVRDGVIVGQGFTQPPGSSHAEVVALRQAGEKARGGQLYVTLEPCCYHGRVPPCTGAIINSGVSEVHLATIDPNPRVSGKGKAELERQGIKTVLGEHESEAKELIEAFAKHITTGMPFVVAKFAMSLDGKIATRTGDSRWISGEESRRYAHNLRFAIDAVMTGANTVIVDDPQLTARCCGGRGGPTKRQPLRVVVDGRGRLPLSAKVFQAPGKTLVVWGKKATDEEKAGYAGVGAELLELPGRESQIDLKSLLRLIGERGITSVLVEGGGILLGSLFDAGLVDKVIAFVAPVVIGGSEAKTAVAGEGSARVADCQRLERVKTEAFGADLMISGYVRGRACSPA